MHKVAKVLGMAPVQVYEAGPTFSTSSIMFVREPTGKDHFQECGTTPYTLAGARDTVAAATDKAGCAPDGTSDSGLFQDSPRFGGWPCCTASPFRGPRTPVLPPPPPLSLPHLFTHPPHAPLSLSLSP